MTLPAELKESVALICYKESRRLKLAGATVFMALEGVVEDQPFVYAVAPRRAIELVLRRGFDRKVYMRMNIEGGASTFLKVDARQWRFHPEDPSVDLAILPWAPPAGRLDFKLIREEMIATDEVIQREGIDVADDVLLSSVFASHFGAKRNLPVLRSGIVSMLANGPVRTEDMGDIDAHLIEANSYGGLAGSPVFVRKRSASNGGESFYLLGLVRGHWRLPISYSDLVVEEHADDDNLNSGIAVVIPASKMMEMTDHPDLKWLRAQEGRLRDKDAPPAEAPEQPAEESPEEALEPQPSSES